MFGVELEIQEVFVFFLFSTLFPLSVVQDKADKNMLHMILYGLLRLFLAVSDYSVMGSSFMVDVGAVPTKRTAVDECSCLTVV